MADIRNTILSRYKIDIAEENLFKLYKLESADIDCSELEEKLKKARSGWTAGANSPNEKVASRFRERLSHADTYEQILRNDSYRKELFRYYQKGGKSDAASGKDPAATAFAEEYFKLVATTKKIKKEDVDFFFDYYQSENKNKKAIYELLKKQYRVRGLGKGEEAADADAGDDGRESADTTGSRLIVSLFKDSTLILIRKCFDRFDDAAKNAADDTFMYSKFPALRDGLYELCALESAGSIEDFKAVIEAGRKLSFELKQEKGESYTPLVNLFNNLQRLSRCHDVTDNFGEFRLLIKYPDLSPYMYAFADMKKSTLDGLYAIAGKRYGFSGITDFILNYYLKVHDNFGISDSGIRAILKKAENRARSNALLGKLDKFLGKGGDGRHLPPAALLIHVLIYWPIFASYLVFETARAVFTELKKAAAVISILLVVFLNWFFSTMLDRIFHTGFNLPALTELGKILFRSEGYEILGASGQTTPQEAFTASLIVILLLLCIYFIPPLLFYLAAVLFSREFNSKKNFDWEGIERTWQAVLSRLRERTAGLYALDRAALLKKSVPGIMVNIVLTLLIISLIHFVPAGLDKLGGQMDHVPGTAAEETVPETMSESMTNPETEAESEAPHTIPMVITVDAANIRSGPGTDYEVVSKGYRGNVYEATGNTGGSGSSTWYEIYLDDTYSETGWASEKVIGFE